MITTTRLCLLDVSAASGLVAIGDRLYVVADDEPDLLVYDRRGARRASIPLFEGTLPSAPAARKAAKADLEVLARVPGGRLLALGSGSAPARRRAAVIDLAAMRARELDAGALYEALGGAVPELNLEGAAVTGDRLRLLQRGNGRARWNAIVDLALAPLLAGLDAGRLGAGLIERAVRVDLGALDGVPCTFTDASPLDDGALLFSAAAEDTDDPYTDGPCAGSVLGVLDAGGRVRAMDRVPGAHKIEGVHGAAEGGAIEALLVADADDPGARAPLLAARYAPG